MATSQIVTACPPEANLLPSGENATRNGILSVRKAGSFLSRVYVPEHHFACHNPHSFLSKTDGSGQGRAIGRKGHGVYLPVRLLYFQSSSLLACGDIPELHRARAVSCRHGLAVGGKNYVVDRLQVPFKGDLSFPSPWSFPVPGPSGTKVAAYLPRRASLVFRLVLDVQPCFHL